MKANIKGYWVDIEICNTDLYTADCNQHRMDTIGFSITSHERFGTDHTIQEAHLYPEDVQNLIKALESVLEDSIDLRRRFHIKNPYPPEEEITTLELDGCSEVYDLYLSEKKKELDELFKSDEWFSINRNDVGVADTWGTFEDLYKEYMPFLVWNSETSRAEFVDEGWKESGLYKEISWNRKYTKLKGINI